MILLRDVSEAVARIYRLRHEMFRQHVAKAKRIFKQRTKSLATWNFDILNVSKLMEDNMDKNIKNRKILIVDDEVELLKQKFLQK